MKKLLPLFSIGLIAVSGVIAHADTIVGSETFTLTQGGSTGPTPGDYGMVTLTEYSTGTTTYVTGVENLANSEFYVRTGAGDALAFNIAAAAGTVTVTPTSAGFSDGAPNSDNPFGAFLQTIDCDSSYCGNGGSPPHDSGPIDFTVTSTNGVTLADFMKNSANVYFASDILYPPNGNTGVVAANSGTINPIPEPNSLILLGTGIVGLAGMVRRKLMA